MYTPNPRIYNCT